MDKKTLEELNKILVPRIKEFFPEGKIQGNHFLIPSPFREDKNPDSFKISLSADDPFWFDHATKEGGNITTLLERAKGLSLDYLLDNYMPQGKIKQPNYVKIKTVYEYKNSSGNKSAFIYRYDWIENGERKKSVKPYSFSNGKWDYNANGFEKPRALFNMDKLSPDKKILIVEGEKTCLFAQKFLGDEFVVLTWPFGAGSVHLANWGILKLYINNPIYVWPDNDNEGLKTVNYLGDLFGESIHIVDVSQLNLPDGWDLANIGDADPEMNKDFSKQEVLDILSATKPYFKMTEENLPTPVLLMDKKSSNATFQLDLTKKINEPVNYESNSLLNECFQFVSDFKILEENNPLNVFMNKNGVITGNSVSAVLFFAIDYYKSSHDETSSNRLFILSNDGKLLLRQIKKRKGKVVSLASPIKFNDNSLSKYHDYYNHLFKVKNNEDIKAKLKYNGTSYEHCKKLLQTLLAYALVDKTESEACAIATIHFISQVKLKMNNKHKQVMYHSAPVFINTDQGSGKTEFIRVLCQCLGDLFVELNIKNITDETYWKMMSTKVVVFGDDFEKIRGDSLATYKSLSTSNAVLTRKFYSQDVPTYMHNCTYIFTANTENLGEKVVDETGNRRFMPFLVGSFHDLKIKKEDFDILKPLYLQENPEFVFPMLPFNQMNLSLLWQSVDEEWSLEKWYFEEIEKIKLVQKKHMTRSTIDEFIERYEIQKSETWVPSGMIYSIYMKEVRDADNIGNFTKAIKKKFGEFCCMPRIINKKSQRAYKICFNSALDEKLKKEFGGVVLF